MDKDREASINPFHVRVHIHDESRSKGFFMDTDVNNEYFLAIFLTQKPVDKHKK